MPPKKAKTASGHVKCDPIPEGTLFKGTYKREIIVGKEFAQGGFGRICDAKLTGKTEKLIIKLEPSGNGPLFTEMHVFQRIFREDMLEAYKKKHKLSHLGLPYLVDSGMQEEIRFLVMPKYSFCLDTVVKESRSPLKLENVVDILICVCNALKYMHGNDYVHADIKAANIMMNKKNGFNEVYLIDFGLARKVGTVVEKEDKKKAHDGTALFTSTDAHRGCGFTFRGDAEILGHNALFWLTKTLPWKNIFDEDATIKIKAEQLGEIRTAKEELFSNLSTNLKKLIRDSAAASIVQVLYKASKIDINTKPDLDAVIKTLSTANKGKKKTAADSYSEDTVPPPSTRRGRKPVIRDDDSDEEFVPAAKVPPPSASSKTTRKKKSESDIEELDPPARRRAKKEEDEPTPLSTKPSRRGKGATSDFEMPSSSSVKSRQTSENEIIPGLKTKNAGKAAMPSFQEEEEETDDEEYEPPKSGRRNPTNPKVSAKIETSKHTSRSHLQSAQTLPDSTPSRTHQITKNEIIPGLKTKNAGKPPMPSHDVDQEEEADDEEYEPPKSARRNPTTSKTPAQNRISKHTSSTRSHLQSPHGLSDSTPSRAYLRNEIIPGLKNKNVEKPPMVSFEEDETDDEEYEPPKSVRRNSPPPKLYSRTETLKYTSSTRSHIQSPQALPNSTPYPRRYPHIDRAVPQPIKKPTYNSEFSTMPDNHSNRIQTPQTSSSHTRTRSIDHDLFSSRIPSTANHQHAYKNTQSKSSVPLTKRRSRSFENTPPLSPEFHIQKIPPPQGCCIM